MAFLNSRKRSFIFEALATASVSLVRAMGAAAAFAFTAYASSILGPEDAGIFFVSITWAYGLAIIARWGGGDLILMTFAPLARGARAMALPSIMARYTYDGVARILIIMFLLGFGVLLAAPPGMLAITSGGGTNPYFIIGLALSALGLQLAGAAVKAAGKPVTASIVEFCLVPGLTLVAYLLFQALFHGSSAMSPLCALQTLYLAASLMAAILLMRMKGARIAWARPFKRRAMRRTLKRSHDLAIIELSLYLASWAALLMIPWLLGAHDAGLYNAVLRIAGITQIITVSVPSVFIPRLAVSVYEKDWAQARLLIRNIKLVMAMAAIVLLVAIVVLGKWALGLFGPDFVAAYDILLIISAGFCAAMALGPAGAMLNLLKQERAFRNTTIATGFASLALSVPAMMVFGLTGAAWVAALSTLGNKLVLVWLERRVTSRWPG